MARIRSDLQIEKGLPAGNKILAKPDGETEVVQIEPYKVSPTTWIADDAGIYENIPGQFEIPSLPYAKDVDTVFSRGGKVFKYNAGGGYFELVFNSVAQVIEASENDIATFAANSGNYTFTSGDFIAIPDGVGGYNLFIYNGGTKLDTNSYLPLGISQVDWSQVNNTPTTLAGYGITDAATSSQGNLADSSVQSVTGAGVNNTDPRNPVITISGSGIQSVTGDGVNNTDPDNPILSFPDADQIDDSTTTNKFITQPEKNSIASAVQPGDLADVATSGDYDDLLNTPPVPDSLDDLSGTSDDVTEGTSQLFFTLTERNKLSGIAPGAEVNVNADWNASSGDAEILNKPTLGTASAADVGDFATAAQGNLADSSVQSVTGAGVNNTDPKNPIITISPNGVQSVDGGTGIDVNSTDPDNPQINLNAASISSLQKADSAVQPGDLATVATSGEFGDLQNTPDFVEESERDQPGGFAGVGVDGFIPSLLLPSYVDDVLEFADFSSLPATGESGKIYITIDDNLTYRWSGSTYVEISASLALGETSSTAYRGDRGKTAYDHSQVTSGNPHNVTSSDVGLGNVDNTSDTDKPVSTAQGQAINQAEADAKLYTDDEIIALNLGTASQSDVGDFATAAQGAKADTALQTESDPTVPAHVKNITSQNIADWNNADPNPTDTDEVPEGSTNKYYTETRVSSNSDVAANTSNRHSHANKALLDTYTQTDADIAQAISDANTAIQPSDIDTLAELNSIITDANLDDESNPRPPTAHTHTTSEITDFDAEVSNNVDVSQNTADRHTHANKAALDNVDNTGAGNLFLSDDGTYKGVASGSAEWGTIIGTLSSQTDLQNELDGKSDVGHQHTASDITDFDTAVGNNADVAANTNARHTHANKTDLDNYDPSNFATAAQGAKADTAIQTESDPTVPAHVKNITSQNIADWNAADPNPTDTDQLPEGATNKYYTETRVSSNSDVAANTSARHTHSNKALLDTYNQTNADITQAISDASTAVQPGDLATVATTGAYSDLSGDSDDISEGTTNLFMTSLERSKLTGIESGAEVNVNADWSAVSGDAQILNKPTLGTAAAADTGDFATAAQGSLANTALQPGSNISELNNDENYIDASGAPIQSVTGSAVDNSDPENPVINLGVGGVQSVTGDGVDNVDPENPVLSFPDADEVDDTTTTNKFVTAAEKADIASALQPGDNISQLNNNSGYVDAAGAASAAPVQSVNSQSGPVVLDADDIDDTATVNKFVTQALINTLNSAVQPGDLATVATSGDYEDLLNKPSIPDSLDDLSGNSDDIAEGTAHLFMTTTERNKLSGIDSGAEVNVNADWNAVSGDAQILNKPTLGTAAAADTGDFATAMQGALADTAVQPGDLATVATTGAYLDLSGTPTLGTAAAADTGDFATAAQGGLANTAVQPNDLADVATSGDYDDLSGTPTIPNSLGDLSGDSDGISEGTTNLFMTSSERSKLTGIASGAEVNVNADWNAVSGDAEIFNKPTLGTAAAADTGDFATAAQGSLANTAVQPGDLSTVATSGEFGDLQNIPDFIEESERDQPGGFAGVGMDGFIPSLLLPSYVDDVLEFADFASLPTPGESGKIYVTIDDNLTYRWSGSTYVEISPSLALGATSSTAYRGDRGKTAYDHSQVTSGNPHNVTASEVGLGNVDNTSDADKPVSTAQGLAINQAEANANQYTDQEIGNLGTAAQADTGDFATAAQGSLADTAIQSSEKGAVNGVSTLDADQKLTESQIPNVYVVSAAESDIVTFAANSGDYTFKTGDYVIITGSQYVFLYVYSGGSKTDYTNYVAINSMLIDPVLSVNSQTGSVVLDADDIDDAATTNKFVTAAEKSDIASAIQPGDLATVATTGAYLDLSGTPTLGTASAADTGDFATAAQGTLAGTAVQPGDLATVATTGAYLDLSGTPAIPEDSTDLGDTGDLVRNNADTYNSTPKVLQVITVTSAEMDDIINEVVSPIAGALYFEV